MATITLPSDLEHRLADEANRRGTTLELLALDGLRKLFPPPNSDNDLAGAATLFDYLKDYISAIDGPSEPLIAPFSRAAQSSG